MISASMTARSRLEAGARDREGGSQIKQSRAPYRAKFFFKPSECSNYAYISRVSLSLVTFFFTTHRHQL